MTLSSGMRSTRSGKGSTPALSGNSSTVNVCLERAPARCSQRMAYRCKIIDIPRAEIIGAREAKVFKTAVRGGRSHLVVQIPAGEIGFYVSSNVDWINAIKTVVPG